MLRTLWENLHQNTSHGDFRRPQSQRPIFAVSNPALPRNMRSLFLASERYSIKYPLFKKSQGLYLKLLPTDKRAKNAVLLTGIFVCLSLILLMVITVLIVLLVHVSLQTDLHTKAPQYLSKINNHFNQTLINQESSRSGDLNSKREFSKSVSDGDRSRCYKTCWPYTAFRFESRCRHGYCYCKGHGYNNWTCLPIFGECIIQKHSNNGVAFYLNKKQRTFGCNTPTGANDDQVYIISVMNERQSQHIVAVNITTALTKSSHRAITDWTMKLVLASYYPIHWRVALDQRLTLLSVTQISTVRVHEGRLTVNGKNPTKDNTYYTRQRSLVGYGDDRNSGHTHHLLETVQRRVGNFASFIGAKEADTWQVTIHPKSQAQKPTQTQNRTSTRSNHTQGITKTLNKSISVPGR